MAVNWQASAAEVETCSMYVIAWELLTSPVSSSHRRPSGRGSPSGTADGSFSCTQEAATVDVPVRYLAVVALPGPGAGMLVLITTKQ